MYPEGMVRGMREELTSIGFAEMRTPEAVDAALKEEKRHAARRGEFHLRMRRGQGSPSDCGGSLESGSAGSSDDCVCWPGSGSYGARAKLLHRVCAFLPFDRAHARRQSGVHAREARHRES